MRRHLEATVKAAQTALYQGGSIIMTEAKQRAPVDKGPLQNSGYVTLPVTRSGDTFVEVGFGGSAKAYAVKQHEELSYNHDVGEAKYLEKAINAREQVVRERIRRIANEALHRGHAPGIGGKIHSEVPE